MGIKNRRGDASEDAANRSIRQGPGIGPLLSAVLRGGRVTKYKGVAASYAPQVGAFVPAGRVSAGALLVAQTFTASLTPAALLLSSTSALAQDACVEVNPGEFVCEDNGAPATTTQTVAGADVTVSVEDGFEIDTTGVGGNALNVSATGSLVVSQIAGVSNLVGDSGIYATHTGDGPLEIISSSVTGTTDFGVLARTGPFTASSLHVDTSAGTVSGQRTGLAITHRGTGAAYVRFADVTGARIGVVATATNAALTLQGTMGKVYGGLDGITAFTTGSDLSINDIGSVIGQTGVGIFASTFGGALSITNIGSISAGGSNGIFADTTGGDISILGIGQTGGISASSDGIYGRTNGTGSVTIDSSAGAISGGFSGIRIYNVNTPGVATGSVSITTADATGAANDGIYVRTYGSDIMIDSLGGSVEGGDNGIFVRQLGNGETSITTADVTGSNSNGVYVYGDTDSGDITIDTSAGTVSGGARGVNVLNFGTGDVSITTADVVATTSSALRVVNFGGDLTIDTSAGAVMSAGFGIDAGQSGTGSLSITTGDVTAGMGDAVAALGRGTSVHIDTSAGSVSGNSTGINASNFGSGDTRIISGDVTGASGSGINLFTDRASGNIFVDGTGSDVDGAQYGIRAEAYVGAITIEAVGSVIGRTLDGISAQTRGGNVTIADIESITSTNRDGILVFSNNGDVSIQNVASIEAGDQGITVRSSEGAIDIGGEAAIGNITAVTDGIAAIATGSSDITINTTAGTITGGTEGIEARHLGSGSVSITTADVNGGALDGIFADTLAGGDITINTTSGTVTGGTEGIDARQLGSGSVSITTADVIGVGFDGIFAETSASGGDLSIDTVAGTVTGQRLGIFTIHQGTGALSITTADVNAASGTGVYGGTRAVSTDLSIDTSAGSLEAETNGVDARHQGTGAVSVYTANVTSRSGTGVYASNSNYGASLSIDTSAGTVEGFLDGIDATHTGSGALSITTGNISSSSLVGIDAFSGGNATDLTIDTSAGSITAQAQGINAVNTGSGLLSLVTGNVTSNTTQAISANNTSSATDLSIDTSQGALSGLSGGISALNQGTGLLSVITADVTTQLGIGVSLSTNGGSGILLDTTAGTISSDEVGIFVQNSGNSQTSITTADVFGGSAAGSIAVTDFADGVSIDSTAGTVSGERGINVSLQNKGDASITSADVVGTNGDAINVFAVASASSVSVDTVAGAVSGDGFGIRVSHFGTGAVDITTADVTAQNFDAIIAYSGGTDLTIDTSAGTVSGQSRGIFANHSGTGAVAITTAEVNGLVGDGVLALNTAAGTDVSVNTSAGAVMGQDDGVEVFNYGTGATSVVTANASGAVDDGVYARNEGTTLTIDTSGGAVEGGEDGVFALNFGSGNLSIATSDATGASGYGIFAINNGVDLSIDSSAGDVAGGSWGILAFNNATGAFSLTAGDVTGGSQAAIEAVNRGTDLTIDTSVGRLIGATSGLLAINDGTGAALITVDDVTGMGADGVFAQNSVAGTRITLQGSSGDVTGATNGVYLRTNGGDVTVQNLDSVTGQEGDGLNLVNEGVAITVSGIGTITGTGGNGILADTIDGTISIQSVGLVGGVTGTGDFGILATGAAIDIGGVSAVGDVSGSVAGISAVSTDPGDVTINTSAGAVSGGTNAISVTAVGEGDLSVTTADLTSEAAEGLSLSNSLESGDIVVNTAAGTVEGGTFGIALNNQGTGTTSITTADVTGTSQTGISAVNQASAVDLEINSSAGSVTGALDGIQATNLGTGALTIMTANVAGMADDGVLAFNSAAATDLAVDTSAGTVSAIDLGVSAINFGSGTTAVTTADVTSANGTAIEAVSVAGDIAINTALGDVVGVNAGVAAMQMGTGALSVTTGDVSASAGNAVHAQTGADAGALMINTSAGNAMGSVNGVYASHSGSGDLSVTTALAMGDVNGVLTNQGAGGAQVISVADATGLANAGVSANTGGASLSIAVTGRASGLETGVHARNNGTGALAITVAEAYGTNTAGILARNGDAETPAGTSLSISSTGVVQGATGIDAANNGSGALTITTADVTGTAANAVTASSAGTDLTIDTSAGTLGGQTNGILASNTGSGATTITAADALGVDGAAIAATNSASASDLNLALSGTVMGNEAGIIVDNAGTGATRITTSGAIMAVSGEAIRVSGAGADVTNDGLVMGFVTFGEGDDSFTNNGEFGASANSVFGAGTNVFTNTNLLTVTSAGPVSLEGVTTFANTGTISLVDSQIGNNLTLPGDFNGTGASRLALDFSFNDMQSDVLTIGGAASGSTVVSLNLLEDPGASMFDDILIIDAGAGSEEGAFTLEGGRQQIGLLRFEVAFDSASDDYFVISLPTDEALQTSNFAESARNLWWQSLDAWSNQLASLRNQVSSGESSLGAGGDNSTRVWFTANASEIQRDRVETFTSGLGTTVIDLGYEQDFLGFQGGLDYGNDVLRFGVTGGYLVSEYEFASTSDRIDYDVFNIGAYLTLDTGAFFANALVKYDTINGQFEGGSGFLNGDMDGSTFGARGEVGALIGERAGVFLEPRVSLSWIDANLDDIATAQGGFEFSEDSSLLGRFGARVGKGFGSGKTKGVAYLGAHYVSEFQGDDAVAFTSNGRAETFGARPFEDFVETRAGVTLGSETSPWSGGIEGHLLFGDDLDGYGVSANVRYRF